MKQIIDKTVNSSNNLHTIIGDEFGFERVDRDYSELKLGNSVFEVCAKQLHNVTYFAVRIYFKNETQTVYKGNSILIAKLIIEYILMDGKHIKHLKGW